MSKTIAIAIAWVGAVIGWACNFIDGAGVYIVFFIGLALAVVGCIFWAKTKGRDWAFGFWGILAPIGFLGVSLLKDKSTK